MALIATEKDWDDYVACPEAVAQTPGFVALRDGILTRAALGASDTVVDLGAGTGLLTLPAARRAARGWAVDISRSMCDYVRRVSTRAQFEAMWALLDRRAVSV